MNAWLCETLDGIGALRWQDVPTPEPGAGEVRIAVRAASLNFPDLLIVEGKYQIKPPLPFVPGAEFAGVIDAVGDGVTHLKVGDPVAAIGGTGGFATHACVDAERVLPLPPGFALDDAAAFAFTYGTSHHALIDRARTASPARRCWCWAPRAASARRRVQIAKAVGARVIAAASSDEKCAFCRELGADETINYGSGNLRDSLKALTGGKGPDVVYDPVGGDAGRTGVPLHRLARPLPRGRLRAGRHPGAAVEPGAAQGRVDRRRVLGRLRRAASRRPAPPRWRSWRSGTRRARSSR